MKKPFILLFVVLIFSFTTGLANLGIGLGTRGVSLKLFPEARVFPTFRTGLGAGYSIESFDFAFTPEVSANLNFLDREAFHVYGGLGLRGFTRLNVGSNDDIYNFNLFFMMPIGVECRPIPDNDRLSLCIEAQVNFARSGTIDPGLHGLVEIIYHFNLMK